MCEYTRTIEDTTSIGVGTLAFAGESQLKSMPLFMNNFRLLLLGVWLGAAIFFSATVAPAAFGVLRGFQLANANEIAGAIVTRTLSIVNISGFAISLFLLATAFLVKRRGASGAGFYLEIILLAMIAILTGASQWWVSPRMLAIRAALPRPIDQIARNDPQRVAFDTLHHYSVALLGIAVLASLIAFFVMARQRRKA